MSPRASQQDWAFWSTERQEERKLLNCGEKQLFDLADNVSLLGQSNGLGMPDDCIKPQFLNHSSVNWKVRKGLLYISFPNQDLTLEFKLASQIALILWGGKSTWKVQCPFRKERRGWFHGSPVSSIISTMAATGIAGNYNWKPHL